MPPRSPAARCSELLQGGAASGGGGPDERPALTNAAWRGLQRDNGRHLEAWGSGWAPSAFSGSRATPQKQGAAPAAGPHPFMRNWEAAVSARLKSLDNSASWRPCAQAGRGRNAQGCLHRVAGRTQGGGHCRAHDTARPRRPSLGPSPAIPAAQLAVLHKETCHPRAPPLPPPCSARTARCAARPPAARNSSPRSGS